MNDKKQERLDIIRKKINNVLKNNPILELEHINLWVSILANYKNIKIPVQVFAMLGKILNDNKLPAEQILRLAIHEKQICQKCNDDNKTQYLIDQHFFFCPHCGRKINENN